MIVTCQNCSSRFKIPDDKIPSIGTMARCSKCKVTFFVQKPEAEPQKEVVSLQKQEEHTLTPQNSNSDELWSNIGLSSEEKAAPKTQSQFHAFDSEEWPSVKPKAPKKSKPVVNPLKVTSFNTPQVPQKIDFQEFSTNFGEEEVPSFTKETDSYHSLEQGKQNDNSPEETPSVFGSSSESNDELPNLFGSSEESSDELRLLDSEDPKEAEDFDEVNDVFASQTQKASQVPTQQKRKHRQNQGIAFLAPTKKDRSNFQVALGYVLRTSCFLLFLMISLWLWHSFGAPLFKTHQMHDQSLFSHVLGPETPWRIRSFSSTLLPSGKYLLSGELQNVSSLSQKPPTFQVLLSQMSGKSSQKKMLCCFQLSALQTHWIKSQNGFQKTQHAHKKTKSFQSGQRKKFHLLWFPKKPYPHTIRLSASSK